MSTKCLDKIGLFYFWTELKAWIASASSNLVHRTGDGKEGTVAVVPYSS